MRGGGRRGEGGSVAEGEGGGNGGRGGGVLHGSVSVDHADVSTSTNTSILQTKWQN